MNIIIKGGEFNNKGSEAMSLIAVYNVIKRFPDANIYFYDFGYRFIYGDDLNIKSFSFPNWYLNYRFGLCNKRKFFIEKVKNYIRKYLPNRRFFSNNEIRDSLNIIKKADYLIDISGFALSSKFTIVIFSFYNRH